MLLYQLVNIRKELDDLSKYKGIEFAYAVFKNKQIIDNKLTAVDFIKNLSPEVIEYENKRIAICELYSDKDEDGKVIIKDDLYLIKDKENFEKDMDVINNEYKPYIEKRQEQIEIFNAKMNEEVDIEFQKVDISDVPPDFNTANDLEKIAFMLK